MKPELEERQRKLEEILQKEAHISLGDRLRNVWYNIKENAGNFIPFGFFLGLGGLVALDFYALFNHMELTSSYQDAYDFVKSLHGTFASAIEHGIQLKLSPEMIEFPKKLIEQGSQQIYREEAQELLKGISQYSGLFSKGTVTKPIIEYLETLRNGLSGLADSGKEILLFLGGVFGAAFDGLGLIFAATSGLEYSSWESKLNYKRRLKRSLNVLLPQLKEKLDKNSNAEHIYDFLDVMVESGISGSHLLEIANVIADYSDEKYRAVFEAITLHPQKYMSMDELQSAFREFDKLVEKENSKLDNENISSYDDTEENINLDSDLKLFKPVKYTKIYLTLLEGGWCGRRASSIIERVEKIGKAREYFFETLVSAADKETLFSNVLDFYEAFYNIDDDKRLSIAKYLLRKGNRQFSKRLTSCRIRDGVIMQYISGLDEVPSVGVKGQIKVLMRLNNLVKHLTMLGQGNKIADLRKILSYSPPKFNDSAVEVGQFLLRHPNISVEEVFGALAEYYHLTGGDQFKSKWIKKEKSRLVPVNRETLEGLLDKKGERKFVEELKRKVTLARFEAFNKAIDDLYFAPLDDMLGEKIDRTGLEMTDDLINVILGYNQTDFKDELQPQIRALVKNYLKNPEGITTYLAGLDGNRRLEERLGQVLVTWRNGHTSSYKVGLDRKIKQKIQDQIREEYLSFARCVINLGYKFPFVNDVVQIPKTRKEAERVFKEISQLNVPKDKQYLVIEAKHHLTKIKQKSGIVKKGYGTIIFYDSQDPIEAMQMGVVSASCTNLVNGIYSFASFVNALDDNKKVVYMTNEEGIKIGRTLAVLTDGGIVTYKKYEDTNLNTDEAWVDYFQEYAQKVGIPLIVPERFVTSGLKKALKSRGAKEKKVTTVMQKAVCNFWYDDGNGGRVKIGDKGYRMSLCAYVIE